MKLHRKDIALAALVAVVLTAVAGFTIRENMRVTAVQKPPICDYVGQHYTMTIKNGKITPDSLHATLCDELTVVNQDGVIRNMSFGPHDHHIVYDGQSEHVVDPGQSFTIMLNQKGSYILHDHFNETVAGWFEVR